MNKLAVLLIGMAGLASAQSKGSSSVPVITEFRDGLNPVDRIRSDGAPYHYSATISGQGHFQFTATGRDRFRQILLDFSDPLSLASASPFASGFGREVSMNTKNFGEPGGLLTLPVGATVERQFRVRFFDQNDKEWILRFFSDSLPALSSRDGNCGGHISTGTTNLVQVQRVSQDQWTLSAAAGNAVGCLYEGAGNVIGEPVGAFHLPFRITLTKK